MTAHIECPECGNHRAEYDMGDDYYGTPAIWIRCHNCNKDFTFNQVLEEEAPKGKTIGGNEVSQG